MKKNSYVKPEILYSYIEDVIITSDAFVDDNYEEENSPFLG